MLIFIRTNRVDRYILSGQLYFVSWSLFCKVFDDGINKNVCSWFKYYWKRTFNTKFKNTHNKFFYSSQWNTTRSKRSSAAAVSAEWSEYIPSLNPNAPSLSKWSRWIPSTKRKRIQHSIKLDFWLPSIRPTSSPMRTHSTKTHPILYALSWSMLMEEIWLYIWFYLEDDC